MCSFQPVPITTQRLSLREAAPRDAQAIAAWSAEAGALLPANPFDEDRKAFVIERHEGEIVGVIGFKPRGRFSELDCWIAPVHRGQGYATEAVPAALAWAAGNWGRKVVLSRHFEGEEAPAAMLITAGFLYTGDVEMACNPHLGGKAPARMMVWLA